MTLPECHANFTKASVKLLTFFESVQVILYQGDLNFSSITPKSSIKLLNTKIYVYFCKKTLCSPMFCRESVNLSSNLMLHFGVISKKYNSDKE